MRMTALLPLCACILALTTSACDESVNPKGDFAEHPVLYALLLRHTQYQHGSQTVLVERLYDVQGLDPYINTKDPTVSGGIVVLRSRSDLDTLREGKRPNVARYPGDQYYYYTNGYQMYPNDSVTVTAQLPGGELLRGSTVIPPNRPVETFPPFTGGVTTFVNRFTNGDAWVLDWSGTSTGEHLFAPKLTLRYTKLVDTIEIIGRVPVPLKYIQSAQGSLPVYPGITYDTVERFEFDALDRTMAQISENDPDKQRYKVLGFDLTLVEYDIHASRYYSSINGALDEFSIRLDETTYSNVSGGIGIVGSAVTNTTSFSINSRYAQSFGYRSNQ